MKYLYINNFRNFSQTYIPIKDVNFLVGENSTGKTSILSLIKLLSNTYFSFSPSFNLADISLGFFSEIATNKKKLISIGVFDTFEKFSVKDTTALSQNETQSGLYLTFKNNNEIPILHTIHYLVDDFDLKVFIDRDTIKYKFGFIRTESRDIDFYKKWSSDYYLQGKQLHILPPRTQTTIGIESLYWNIYENLTFASKSKSYDKIPFITKFDMFNKPAWINPIREKPKRIYDGFNIEDGNISPYALRQLFRRDKSCTELNIISNFGQKSGMFESIGVKNFSNEKGSPFEVSIILNGKSHKTINVGYGVSQVLPIVVDLVTKDEKIFIIQQPEVHLHPKAQASIGEFIFNIALEKGKKFLVETHSDFVIDRFRICHKKSDNKDKIEAQVLFFERTQEGNIVHTIDIDENGEYAEEQPQSFREFFINEEMEVLGL